MQQRQTVIFGTLVSALLVVGLLGGAMWSEVLPTPIDVPINSGAPAEIPEIMPPCPPADAVPVPYNEISANVLNGTETQGLAALTAAVLRDHGIQTGREQNGTPYGGVAQLTAGPLGVASAYTLAALFPESQIVLDAREDASVDVLLGEQYEELLPIEEITLEAEAPIPVPAECRPIDGESSEG
jgi:hypothetical protein